MSLESEISSRKGRYKVSLGDGEECETSKARPHQIQTDTNEDSDGRGEKERKQSTRLGEEVIKRMKDTRLRAMLCKHTSETPHATRKIGNLVRPKSSQKGVF